MVHPTRPFVTTDDLQPPIENEEPHRACRMPEPNQAMKAKDLTVVGSKPRGCIEPVTCSFGKLFYSYLL